MNVAALAHSVYRRRQIISLACLVIVVSGCGMFDFTTSANLADGKIAGGIPTVEPTLFPTSSPSLPVTQLAITGGPATGFLRLGVVEPTSFSLVLKDSNGNPIASHPALTVLLSATGGSSAGFYLPSNLAQTVVQVSVPNGASSAPFLVRATSLSSVAITAQTVSSGSLTVVYHIPVQQVVTSVSLTGPSTLTGGLPSPAGNPFTITLRDGMGNNFCPSTPMNINIASDPSFRATVCLAAGCPVTSQLANATLSTNGNPVLTFYLLTNPDSSFTSTVTAEAQSPLLSPVTMAVTDNRTPLSPDTSFSTAGQATFAFSNADDDEALAAVPAIGNSIFSAGYTSLSGQRQLAVMRVFGSESAQPGMLDTSFNNTGKQVVSIGNYSYAAAVATQTFSSSGSTTERYLVAATSRTSDYDFALLRFRATGAPDPTYGMLDLSFGTNGITNLIMSGNQVANAIVISPTSGNVYVAGNTDTSMLVMGFDMNGHLLTGFGTNGVVQIDFNLANSYANAIVMAPGSVVDNLIVGGVTSSSTGDNFAFVRLNQFGQIDTSYGPAGSNGKISLSVLGSTCPVGSCSANLTSMIVQPTGGILAAGSRTVTGDMVLVRLIGSSGLLDSTANDPSGAFGSTGSGISVLSFFSGTTQIANALAQDPLDGSVYVAGSVWVGNGGGNENFLIVHVTGSTGVPIAAAPDFKSYEFGGLADNAAAVVLVGGKPVLVGGGNNGNYGRNAFAFMSLLR